MRNIFKIVVVLLILVNITGCNSEQDYKMDYMQSSPVSTDILKFTDAFYNNYPMSQEDFDKDIDEAIEKVEENYKMKTKEGKQVIKAYKKFMEHEKEFVDDNWEKYDEIEELIPTDKKAIELKKNFDDKMKELRLKSKE